MAKDKTDYSKLTLGKKKPIKKVTLKTPDPDKIVEKIHVEPEQVQPQHAEEIKREKVPTKRITLDIPVPLHKKIRIRTFGMGISMKQYFLDLAEQEIEINENTD